MQPVRDSPILPSSTSSVAVSAGIGNNEGGSLLVAMELTMDIPVDTAVVIRQDRSSRSRDAVLELLIVATVVGEMDGSLIRNQPVQGWLSLPKAV